jgi:hypothetical protein
MIRPRSAQGHSPTFPLGLTGVRFALKGRRRSRLLSGQFWARSRLTKWCAKAARQRDYDKVLTFLGVARDVSFPVRILNENSFARRKASHLSIARFEFHVATSHMARSLSGGV